MNPLLLFWVPAALRIALVLAGTVIVWLMFGLVAALLAALAAIAAMAGLQLFYLYRLAGWLDHPEVTRLPDGLGAWTDVFSRLYKLRRADEKNRSELTEWLARFRQAMMLLPDGVVIMDDVLFLEWCNESAKRHLGLDHERGKGMRVTNLIRNPAFIDYIVLGRYEQPLALEVRSRKLIVRIIPFETRRQILVTHDVTEASRIENMRRDFLANASHELRTPLTVLNGFLEIASGQPNLDPETRGAHLKLMTEQGLRMQALIEDMLTLSRLESIDYPVRAEPVAITGLLEQVLQEAVALSGGRHRISLHVDGPDIIGSSEELRSAFGNLASNSVRYTAPGGQIDLCWQLREGRPEFTAQDNGIGISAEHIARLTERFYRVDKSRSRETQGTGLGLAIVKHVLLRHKAMLTIKSQPGQGSKFTARFQENSAVRLE